LTHRYIKDLSKALKYLHEELHFIHRDIKPDNLLISEKNHLKLSDFGVA